MAMYAIVITPLIRQLEDETIKQIRYTNDTTAGGKLAPLKAWWDLIVNRGPDYGYYPNASKTWLIVKESMLEEATAIFKDTCVAITMEGRRHLGAAIGKPSFVEKYVQHKVSGWVHEVEHLPSITVTQPHAAYAAFTHGLNSRRTYLSRTIPGIGDLFKPLKTTIRHKFLPSLTGQSPFSDTYRNLMVMPVGLGELGIIDPSIQTKAQYCASQKIIEPLIELIYKQSHSYTPGITATQAKIRNSAGNLRIKYRSLIASELKAKLPSDLQRAVTASTEKGASSWFSTLPIKEHEFAL